MKATRFFQNVSMALAIITGITMTTTLVSCEDEDKFFAEVEYPTDESDDAIIVEAWTSEYTFDIKSNGAWQIETDDRFFEVTPESGSGNATVTIQVQNNQGDERKVGSFNVVFPGNEEHNTTVLVEQKWDGDYDDNAADKITTSNKIYAIGYSYDATGEWASPNSVRMEIFDTHLLNDEGKHVVGPTQASLQETTITGSSISDMTNALAVKANVDGGFGKFKAEANASFDMNHAKNSNYEFATTYFNLDVRVASFDTDLKTLCEDYMTDDAWFAINGKPRENKRTHKKKVSYPSTNEGLKNLIKNYGTHVIVTAKLGGRVRHSMEIDISKITSSYDVKAFAKASYDGTFASGSGSVDEKFKQSYEDNRKNVTIRLNVLGGDESKAKALGTESGFTKDNLNAWAQSVTADNMALVGFDSYSLVPLYELIDESLTLEDDEVDGKARKEALKKYMEGNDIASDFSSYDCGTVTEFDVPTFSTDPNSYSSLVKDVIIDGQYVGQICEEYIPNINKEQRVVVVYPVINNAVRYNMGFFLGNDSHKPARVAWNGTNVTIQEYTDLDFGSARKLYLRGASISAVKTGDVTSKRGEVRTSLLEYQGSSYPVVKIFDKLWMRKDFQATSKNTGWALGEDDRAHNNGTNKDYYSFRIAGDADLAPKGWHVATSADYRAIQNKLEANGITDLGKAFLCEGVLGYNAQFDGWLVWKYNNWGKHWEFTGGEGVQTEYLTSDYYHVRIKKDGSFAIEAGTKDSPYLMSIRCVKD